MFSVKRRRLEGSGSGGRNWCMCLPEMEFEDALKKARILARRDQEHEYAVFDGAIHSDENHRMTCWSRGKVDSLFRHEAGRSKHGGICPHQLAREGKPCL